MSGEFTPCEPIKVTFKDLQRLGIVRSRFDAHKKIKTGRLRPPHKDGPNMQSAAWWYWEEVRQDLSR